MRFLCDRRAGVGGDGYIRAVPARYVPSWDGDPELWFMDYRNADGSLAEMCGNGLRVFARFLAEEGLVDQGQAAIRVATRAGERTATLLPDGRVRLGMGRVSVSAVPAAVSIGRRGWRRCSGGCRKPARGGAPRIGEDLAGIDLSAPPSVPARTFPDGERGVCAACG